MVEPVKYKVAVFKKDETVGVGIERYRRENDQTVIEFIGSYNIGNASRQDAVRFYVREITSMHDRDEEILIQIADSNLRNKKRKWLTSVYPERVHFSIKSTGKFKTCEMLAADACYRGFSITENL